MKFSPVIFSLVYVFCVNYVYSESNCCDSDDFIISQNNRPRCENGKKISIDCTAQTEKLSNSYNDFAHYMIRRDIRGEYVDAFAYGYITRAPHFCTGRLKTEVEIITVAFVCNVDKIWYSDIPDDEMPPPPPLPDRILPFIWEMLNLFSAITLAITAFVYAFLRDLRDSQGICTFHFVFITSLLHANIYYMLAIKSDGLLPNMCITNMYLAIYILLSAFTWCTVMGYNSWTRAKNAQYVIDESTMLKWYRYIGYGLPALMVLISNVYAHAIRLYREFRMEMQCMAHQTPILLITIGLPILISSSLNVFFFVDLQRHLWNSPALELRSEKSTLRKLKYRLILNGKLFFVLGLSWVTFFVFCAILEVFKLRSAFTMFTEVLLNDNCDHDRRIHSVKNDAVENARSTNFLLLLVSGQGIIIFLLLVCFRKRVLRSVSRTWLTRFKIFPMSWENAVDSETCEDHVEDTFGQPFIPYEKEITTHQENISSETNNKTFFKEGTLSA